MLEPAGAPSKARLFLLGAPRGHVAGQDVQITHRKPLAILAYLAVTGRPHTREALAALFWPDHETARAYAYLRNALWQLGQTPFGPWLSADPETVMLLQGIEVDMVYLQSHLSVTRSHDHPPSELCADCTRRLSAVTELYRGEFMEGFTLDDCPDFDEWQFFQAETARQGMAWALETLTRAYSAQGSTHLALDMARRWVGLDPLNEPAQRFLMTLYARDGQRSAALRQYDTLLKDLRASGLQPTAETIDTYKRIRSGEVRAPERPEVVLPEAAGQMPASHRSLPSRSLPAETTAFVGRAEELTTLQRLVVTETCRLISLVGPGGIGKTRLALRLAHSQQEAFPDGVAFVPLTTISAPEGIVPAIADALGTSFYPQSAMSLQEQLLAYLGDRQVLLLLDGMEHLTEGADIIGEILARTTHAKVLVTSRERLSLQGEWVMVLQGLAYPKADAEGRQDRPGIPGSTGTGDAEQLFIETARRVSAGFDPTPAEMDAITRICDLVEGVPLGLELAAAWTKMLSCAEIAEEVATSLDFLTLTLRDMPERHQSLRAVFARSWGLLSEEERRHFRALAVFRGGFSREAALAVADARLPSLSTLMDKSLLQRTSEDRYEILEILRQYAEEQLGAHPGEIETVRSQHANYYLRLAARLEMALKGDLQTANPIGQRQALDQLQKEFDNISAAWQWALAHGWFDEIAHAAVGLALYHDIRSRFRQGEALFREAVQALEAQEAEARPQLLGLLLGIQGEFLMRFGHVAEGATLMTRGYALLAPFAGKADFAADVALLQVLSSYVGIGLPIEERKRRLEESLNTYRALGDDWGTALSQEVLGELLNTSEDWAAAEAPLQDSLHLRRRIGDEWGAAMSLHALAVNAAQQGESTECWHYVEESLALREELGDTHGVIICQALMGYQLTLSGDLAQAEAVFRESLHGYEEIGDFTGVANTLHHLGDLARKRDDRDQAYAYYVSALTQRRRMPADTGLARTLSALGDLALEESDRSSARDYLQESYVVLTELGETELAAGVQERLAALNSAGDAAEAD